MNPLDDPFRRRVIAYAVGTFLVLFWWCFLCWFAMAMFDIFLVPGLPPWGLKVSPYW